MRSNVAEPTYSSPIFDVRDQRSHPLNEPRLPNAQHPRPQPTAKKSRLVLAPKEGWLAMLLLAAAAFCVDYSIGAVGWVSHTFILYWSAAAGLCIWLVIAKMHRLPQPILHLAACLSGHWLRRGSLRHVRACRAEAGAACEGWWSQAGSNRRPRHCERRALPAELWPHRDRQRSGQQSAPFTIRAKAKSRTAKSPFPAHLPGTSLVCGVWNRYLAGGRIRDRTASKTRPCVPFSTSFSSFWTSMSGC